MSVKKVASRYAKSLIDLAQEQGTLEPIKDDMEALQLVCANRDFYMMLKSPLISADRKHRAFSKVIGDRLHKVVDTFFSILLRKGREGYLPEVAEEFMEQYKRIKHVSSVKLTTAGPIDEAVKKEIVAKLLASPNTDDNIEIASEVDPTLIGGFVLEFEGKRYDASVAHKLKELSKEFKSNLYVREF
jgi:F-type H+-transporting ATPase subunit delta